MFVVRTLTFLAAFGMGMLLVTPTETTAQSKGQSAPSAKANPNHAFRVQYRHPGPVVTRFRNIGYANAAAARQRRNGWKVKTKIVRSGAIAVARIPRWKTFGVYSNVGLANHFAANGRSIGMQTRVIRIYQIAQRAGAPRWSDSFLLC